MFAVTNSLLILDEMGCWFSVNFHPIVTNFVRIELHFTTIWYLFSLLLHFYHRYHCLWRIFVSVTALLLSLSSLVVFSRTFYCTSIIIVIARGAWWSLFLQSVQYYHHSNSHFVYGLFIYWIMLLFIVLLRSSGTRVVFKRFTPIQVVVDDFTVSPELDISGIFVAANNNRILDSLSNNAAIFTTCSSFPSNSVVIGSKRVLSRYYENSPEVVLNHPEWNVNKIMCRDSTSRFSVSTY